MRAAVGRWPFAFGRSGVAALIAVILNGVARAQRSEGSLHFLIQRIRLRIPLHSPKSGYQLLTTDYSFCIRLV